MLTKGPSTRKVNRNKLLQEIKKRLQNSYGERLKGVVLYGSEARGDVSEDSDIDVLVLLDGPIRLWKELQTIIHSLYPLSLSYGRPISPKPVDAESFESINCPIYESARRDGIRI